MFSFPPYLPRGKIDGEPHPVDAAERPVLGQRVPRIEHHVLAVVQLILRRKTLLWNGDASQPHYSHLSTLPGRSSGKSSHVRCDAESGNQLKTWRSRDGPLRGVSESSIRVKAQFGNATVGAAEPPAKFAVDILHHQHIGVDVGLVVRVEVSGRQLVQCGCGLRDDGG